MDSLKTINSTPLTSPGLDSHGQQMRLFTIRNGLPKSGECKNIVIVGAGIAGITAASELLRAGHNVTILEATHRPGGRIYSLREPFAENLYGEAGAMRYPGKHLLLKEYLSRFGLKTQEHSNFIPGGFMYLGGKKTRINTAMTSHWHGPGRVLHLWEKSIGAIKQRYFEQLQKGNNIWPEIVDQYNEYSLRSFLVHNGWNEKDIDLFGVLGLGLGGYSSIMNSSFIEILRLFLMENDKGQFSIVGGSDQLINSFLHQTPDPMRPNLVLQNCIRYGAKVTRILQEPNQVTVFYDNASGGHEVSADYMVITAPFPMVRFMDVNPLFSPGKQRAINELHYYSASKIFIQCRTRFWERCKQRTRGMTLTDLPIRSLYFPEREGQGERNVIIASYTWEAESRMWESLSPNEQVRTALKFASKIYPEIIDEFEVGAVCNWHNPKYNTGGAFAIFEPGQMKALYDDIVKPEGRIHFAGDHTSFEHGWVEGAIESGLREASAIAQRIHQQKDNVTQRHLRLIV